MCGTSVLDKDGVSAAVVIAEMATYLQGQGLTLAQKLLDIYETWVVVFVSMFYSTASELG